MGFLEKITERENAFLKKVREVEGKAPLYLWGAGYGGENVALLLHNEGIPLDGVVVNRKYYEGQEDVQCLEDVLETAEKLNLIIAFRGFDKGLLAGYENRIDNVIDYDCWAGYLSGNQSNDITWSWLAEHASELEKTYQMLGDECSRRCFIAYINQKVSMKYGYLSEVKTSYQYFDEELVGLTDREIFVDCGAYDGDTALAFVQALKRRGIDSYREIISFEPDSDNFAKMKALGLERHRCIPRGCSDKVGALYFSPNDKSGTIGESGEIKVDMDTIDHVVGDGEVTMIKMDIEGSELSALQGAENVIKRCRPLLAICLYHKRQDLYEIPQYIMKLVPEYQFYLRAYEDTAIELVLYAIPMNKKYQPPMSANRKPLQELLPLESPLSLFIDPCDACNFKCNFCFQHHRRIAPNILDEALFEKILQDIKTFPEPFKMVHLNGFGEPLLNGLVSNFIRRIKEEKAAETVEITTNGSLLTPELSGELIEAGLDKIIFSIYALKDEGYQEFSGARVSFQRIYENISHLYDIRGGCHIHAKIAGEYFSQEEKEEFIEKFQPIVDSLYIDHAINAWPELKVTENETEHMYGMGSAEKICPMPFYQMVIHSDGKVSPCCVDYGKKLVMGDVKEESLRDIWNGERYQQLRRDILQEMISENSLCTKCSYPSCGVTVDITPYKKELLKKY